MNPCDLGQVVIREDGKQPQPLTTIDFVVNLQSYV